MFREMRRKNQALNKKECEEILYKGSSGVLAVLGDNDYPYAVPLSYIYCGDKIYFHCAKLGHKLDAVTKNPKASFCVIDRDQVMPDEYTSYYRSVIVFGDIRVLNNEKETRRAIESLAIKYNPSDDAEHRQKMIDKEYAGLCMLELSIIHMSGKQAKELVSPNQ